MTESDPLPSAPASPAPEQDLAAPPALPPKSEQQWQAPLPPDSPLHPPITVPPGTPPPNPEERNLGMLTHLLAIFTGFIAPLVFWLVKKDSSPFLDHHGKEALNFQITYFLVSICLMAVGMVVGFLTMGLGFLLMIPVSLAVWILALVWEIQACTAASRGEWYRYPFSFRLIS